VIADDLLQGGPTSNRDQQVRPDRRDLIGLEPPPRPRKEAARVCNDQVQIGFVRQHSCSAYDAPPAPDRFNRTYEDQRAAIRLGEGYTGG